MTSTIVNTLNNLEKMLSTQSEVQKVSEKLHSGMDKAKDFKKIFDSSISKNETKSIKDVKDSQIMHNNSIASNEFKTILKEVSKEANVETSLDLTLAKDINEIISQLKEAVEDANEAIESVGGALENSVSETIENSVSETLENSAQIVENTINDESVLENQIEVSDNQLTEQILTSLTDISLIQKNMSSKLQDSSAENVELLELDTAEFIEFAENTIEDVVSTSKTDDLSNLDLENLLDEEAIKDLKIETISAETDFSGESDFMQNQTPEEHAIKAMINEDVEIFDMKITSAQKAQSVNVSQSKVVDVNPSKILDQISKQLDGLQNNSKVNIVLNPESLGKVNIQLLSTKEGLTAQFVVTTQEAKELLTKGVDGLKESLLSHGVGVDNISVKVSENQKSEYQQDWTEQENSEKRGREQEQRKEEKEKGAFEKMMAKYEDNKNGNV